MFSVGESWQVVRRGEGEERRGRKSPFSRVVRHSRKTTIEAAIEAVARSQQRIKEGINSPLNG